MATVNSNQYANLVAVPLVPGHPYDREGRVRVAWFDLTVGTGTGSVSISASDTVNLTSIPIGARMISGRVSFGAMGAGTTLVVGVSGSTNKYLTSTDVSSAGKATLMDADVAPGYTGDITTAETIIIGTAGTGGNFATGKALRGHILYIVD